MKLPLRYNSKGNNQVCKLLKLLYGLKIAPSKWNEKVCASLFEFGFVQSVHDFSLFLKTRTNFVVILLVYVNDIILTKNNVEVVTSQIPK